MAENKQQLHSISLEQAIQDQKDEVLALKSIFTEKNTLRIINEPNLENDECSNSAATCQSTNKQEEESNHYIIEVDVNMKLDDSPITVNVQLDCCSEDESSPVDDVAASVSNMPQYERTASGYHWNTSFQVKFLPPITLRLTLPSHYPSAEPPQFTLSCQWLDNNQLQLLRKRLIMLWHEAAGLPIIYTWIDWLQHNAVCALGIEDNINLDQSYASENHVLTDPIPPQVDGGLERVIHSLLSYNAEQELEAFKQSLQTCPICYSEMVGSKFFRLPNCQHHFCIDCMSDYCKFHVQEGTVRNLMCLETGCKTVLPPSVLHVVLDDEMLHRWDRLLLQNALDTMGDVFWCPRCNNPVIIEKEEETALAYCMICIYSFCTKCLGSWHLGSACPQDNVDEDPALKDSRKKHKKLLKEKHVQNVKSWAWIKAFSKRCPSCRSPIVKEDGCNKVTCTVCNKNMCWLCGKCINGYDHFVTCNLWNQTYIPRMEQRPVPEGLVQLQRLRENQRQQRQVHVKKCPKCKHDNIKRGRDNHMHCWCCRVHFCYLCLEILQNPITSHYMKGRPCIQHSEC